MSGYTGSVVTRARKTVRARGAVQQCWRCGGTISLDAEPWTVGHLLDRHDGGTEIATNLWVEHPRCNYRAGANARHARDRAQGRADRRLRRW